jgi:hypothetical protein
MRGMATATNGSASIERPNTSRSDRPLSAITNATKSANPANAGQSPSLVARMAKAKSTTVTILTHGSIRCR